MKLLSKHLYSCDFNSPVSPLAIPSELINSRRLPLSNPSAILSIIEPLDPFIWSANLDSLDTGVVKVRGYTFLQRLLALCHICSSSNFWIVAMKGKLSAKLQLSTINCKPQTFNYLTNSPFNLTNSVSETLVLYLAVISRV